MLTPNGDGNGDALTVTFQLAAPATVRLRVLRDGNWVATPFTGPLPAGPQSIGWNGAKRVGKTLGRLLRGRHRRDRRGRHRDGRRCRSCSTRIRPSSSSPPGRSRLWVSEAATVTVRVNGVAPAPPGAGAGLSRRSPASAR